MAQATAQLKNYRQAPRKVRLLADLVRGKSVARALMLLDTLPKRASLPMACILAMSESEFLAFLRSNQFYSNMWTADAEASLFFMVLALRYSVLPRNIQSMLLPNRSDNRTSTSKVGADLPLSIFES